MFDFVLTGGEVPKSRFGVGAVISIAVHAMLVAIVFYFTTRPAPEKPQDLEVRFFAAPPMLPPPPAPLPAGQPTTPRSETKILKKPRVIIQPRQIPEEKPKEAEPKPPSEEPGAPGGVEGGVVSGVVGETAGGAAGGAVGGAVGGQPELLSFGDGMSRPIADPGNRPPQYSREALEARIEGLMLIKCIITTAGELKNCRVLRSLPHMEKAVLEALSKWRFTPVTFQGRSVAVDYVIPVRLVIPR